MLTINHLTLPVLPSQCEPGLFCFQRDADEDVPGCTGDPRGVIDYCIPESFRGAARNLKQTSDKKAAAAAAAAATKDENTPRKLQGDPVNFQTTRTYTLRLDGLGNDFMGFLFRLSGAEGQDVGGVFEVEDDGTQLMASTGEAIGIPGVSAGSCAVGVSGATHLDNEVKQSALVAMTIPASAAGELNLEVTAMINKDLWYATTYTIVATNVDDMEVPEQIVPVLAPAPTAAALAPTAGAPTAFGAVAPPTAAAGVLPDGAVSFPSTGEPNERAFKPPGQCTGASGLCLQCEGKFGYYWVFFIDAITPWIVYY